MKRALLFTLVLLVGLEVATRFVLFPQSKDIVRFAGFQEKADDLARSQALRVAIVSNSSAQDGIDRTRLESLLSQSRGRPVQVEMFLADDSEIVTWHAMLQHYFWSSGARADVYVINYFGSLRDSPQFEYLRVGMFFTKFSDWHYYLHAQLDTTAQRVQFVLSSIWATFGARDRIRDRTLDVFVPGYRDFLELLSGDPKAHTADNQGDRRQFSALHDIISHTEHEGARLVLSAFPTRTYRYNLDPELLSLAAAGHLNLCDLRNTPGLTPTSYRDDIHLIAAGRDVFTERFAAALGPMLVAR